MTLRPERARLCVGVGVCAQGGASVPTKVRLFTPVYESPAPIMYLCIELTPKSDVDVQKKSSPELICISILYY